MSSKNVWAVGDMDNSGSLYQPISEHWNGSAWKSVVMPNEGKDGIEINGATAVGAIQGRERPSSNAGTDQGGVSGLLLAQRA